VVTAGKGVDNFLSIGFGFRGGLLVWTACGRVGIGIRSGFFGGVGLRGVVGFFLGISFAELLGQILGAQAFTPKNTRLIKILGIWEVLAIGHDALVLIEGE